MKKRRVVKKTKPGGHSKRVPIDDVLPRKWKMKRMPKDLKNQLDAMLIQGTMHTSLQFRKWLADNGFEISRQCIDEYRHNFERQLDSVRLATAQAREVCKQFKDDDPNMQTALLRLVQTQLFQVLAVSNGKGRTKRPATVAPVNVGALARCVSNLIKAETDHQKWADHARTRVSAAEKKVEEATTKGLSKDAAQQIKAVLMEI